MEVELMKQKKQEIAARFGEWTAHNIRLRGDVYTIRHGIVGDEHQLRRIVQIISDIAREPLANLRILDLACLEGLYGIELARRGAKVVAIEGREANIEKARFAKDIISLDNLELVLDDVRNFSRTKYGAFDVVLCLGILYHLDVPDVFYFLERIAESCERFALIDTHVSMTAKDWSVYKEKKYWGELVEEHSPSSTSEQIAGRLWMSLDNPRSFHFTRASLYNLLAHVGFTSVYECHYPREVFPYKTERTTLLAIKGQRQIVVSAPLLNALVPEDWPENQQITTPTPRRGWWHVTKKLASLLSNKTGQMLKHFMR